MHVTSAWLCWKIAAAEAKTDSVSSVNGVLASAEAILATFGLQSKVCACVLAKYG